MNEVGMTGTPERGQPTDKNSCSEAINTDIGMNMNRASAPSSRTFRGVWTAPPPSPLLSGNRQRTKGGKRGGKGGGQKWGGGGQAKNKHPNQTPQGPLSKKPREGGKKKAGRKGGGGGGGTE